MQILKQFFELNTSIHFISKLYSKALHSTRFSYPLPLFLLKGG